MKSLSLSERLLAISLSLSVLALIAFLLTPRLGRHDLPILAAPAPREVTASVATIQRSGPASSPAATVSTPVLAAAAHKHGSGIMTLEKPYKEYWPRCESIENLELQVSFTAKDLQHVVIIGDIDIIFQDPIIATFASDDAPLPDGDGEIMVISADATGRHLRIQW